MREAASDEAAERIGELKKADMAREAEALLAGTGWLPSLLRKPAPWLGLARLASSASVHFPGGPKVFFWRLADLALGAADSRSGVDLMDG